MLDAGAHATHRGRAGTLCTALALRTAPHSDSRHLRHRYTAVKPDTVVPPSPRGRRAPGASAVIYGGVEADAVVFEGVADALRVPQTDIRLFGKPQSFVRRRMGVALAHDADVQTARSRAKEAASKVTVRAV